MGLKTYRYRFLILSFIFTIPFQNCSPMHSTLEEGNDSSSSFAPGTTQADRFSSALSVLQAKCMNCHSAGGPAAFAPFDLSDEQAFVSSGLVIPGDVNSSKIITRSQFSGSANGNMPTNGISYTQDDFLALYYWVRDMNNVAPQPGPSPTPTPGPVRNPSVATFNIINTQGGQALRQNVAGVTNINLSELNSNIKLVANGNTDVASVAFTVSGGLTSNIEDNALPYEFYPNGVALSPGTYNFTATPYSQTGLSGTRGNTASLQINVIDDTTPPPANSLDLAIQGFNLIDADTDTLFGAGLDTSVTLQLSQINFNMNVEAIVGSDTSSVEMTLTGAMTHTQQENLAPYAIFPQPTPTDFDGRIFGPGTYIVTATAYENQNLMGQRGLSQSFTITVIDDTPPPPINHLAEATRVLNQYCVGCHSPGAPAGNFPLNFSTDAQFIQAGMVVPGDIDQSILITRLIHYQGNGRGPQDMPKGGGSATFSTADYQVLEDWVKQMSPNNPPPPTNGYQPFACVDTTTTSNTLTYTLTKKQYINTLEDLFGTSVTNQLQQLLALVPDDAYSKHEHKRLNSLNKQAVDTYHRVALNIANQVTASSNLTSQIFGSCANQSTPSATCIDTYLNGMARRIFRRPLTNAELNYARGLANGAGNYKSNINHLLAYHLQSPYFIMRVEVGTANNSLANYQLSPYELATRLAYMATDSGPDNQILNAAANGSIMNLSMMKSEVRRLLQTSRGRQKVKSVLMGWSNMDHPQTLSVLPQTLLSQYYAGGIEQAMTKEAEDFIEYIVYERQGTFQDLLTSKASFASDPDLAKIYSHAPANPLRQIGDPTTMMTGRRIGLLMRAPAMTSDVPRARSIHRGVDFQAAVMCNELPTPPANIFDSRFDMALTPAQLLDTTTRDNVAHLTNDVNCMSCHASINPTGFAFENFGPFGELRSQEQIFDINGNFHQNLAVNTAATVPTWNNKSVAVTDAVDLVNHISTAPEGMACFSRKMFRHLNDKRESVEDDCQLDQIYQQVTQSGSLLEGFVNIIANEPNKRKRR